MQGTIRFELRLEKKLKSGKAPISLIYSTKGERKRLSTGQGLFPLNWDNKTQRGIYLSYKAAKNIVPDLSSGSLLTELEIDEINSNLEKICHEIDNHERDFIRKSLDFSSQDIINLLNAAKKPILKNEEPKNYIYSFIDQYLIDNSATRAKGSLAVYRALKVHLKAYEEFYKTRITFESTDYKFFQSFHNFLIEERDILNTTIAKQLSTLKTFLGYAQMHEINVNQGYRNYKIKRESLEVIALTQSELDALLELDLTNNIRLMHIRDVFCFGCSTGLRYSDLRQLSWEHIRGTEIVLTTIKVKEILKIPLSTISQTILNTYSDKPKPLPVISATNMNIYIKELCKLAGINDRLEKVRFNGPHRIIEYMPKHQRVTIHTARKTFVTLSSEKGMSAEEIMATTGHKAYRSFSRYLRITDDRKKVAVIKAWGAPEKANT
jgi:integrase